MTDNAATTGTPREDRTGTRRDSAVTLIGVALLAAAVFVGVFAGFLMGQGLPNNPIVPVEALVSQSGPGGGGDFTFFTYRRYLWAIRRSTGTCQFFTVPESKTSDQAIEPSRIYTVDPENFPLDQVLYQVSDRNLTNYLWITNPVTGRARFIRARRDGGFDESPIVEVGKTL